LTAIRCTAAAADKEAGRSPQRTRRALRTVELAG
jgi:hypothetical protein